MHFFFTISEFFKYLIGYEGHSYIVKQSPTDFGDVRCLSALQFVWGVLVVTPCFGLCITTQPHDNFVRQTTLHLGLLVVHINIPLFRKIDKNLEETKLGWFKGSVFELAKLGEQGPESNA